MSVSSSKHQPDERLIPNMSLAGIYPQNNSHPLNRKKWRSSAADALTSGGFALIGEQLRQCGDMFVPGAVVFCDSCGDAKALNYTCHSRLCPDCERKAQAQRLEKYLPLIAAATHRRKFGYAFKHVTITTTIELEDDDVAQTTRAAWGIAKKALDKVLFDKFEQLEKFGAVLLSDEERRRKVPSWKRQEVGAVAGGEFGEDGNRFHMHFFMYSPYIAHEELTDELKRLTDGKWFVNWIKPKHDAEDAKEVMAKYATKLTELPPNLLPKLQSAIAGQRRIRNYGCWFGVPSEDDEPSGCKHCGNRLRFEAIESTTEWQAIILHGVDAWYTWRHADDSLLDLRHGNKSREIAPKPPDRPWLHLL